MIWLLCCLCLYLGYICSKYRKDCKLLRRVLRSYQDGRTVYSACPKCSSLVALTGCGLLAGTCARCGYFVSESDMEKVDPVEVVNMLQDEQERDGDKIADLQRGIKLLRALYATKETRL